MVDFAQTLAKVMCLSDVANLTGLDWDRVKDVVKDRLEEDYGRLDLRHLTYLSIDEIYVGKSKKFYTVVIDLESGRIVWVGTDTDGYAHDAPVYAAAFSHNIKIMAIAYRSQTEAKLALWKLDARAPILELVVPDIKIMEWDDPFISDNGGYTVPVLRRWSGSGFNETIVPGSATSGSASGSRNSQTPANPIIKMAQR